MNNIQLSIIVPIYNVEEYLEDCLHSIYSLATLNYEVILVNDGSPDNSDKIIEQFAQQYPNHTQVVNKSNGGLSSARNAGINVAKGEYIALIDSDDYISSDALLELYKHAKADDLDIAIAQSLTFWGDSNAKAQELTIPNNVINLGVTSGLNLLETSFNARYKRINCWNKIYKREFMQQHQLNFIDKLIFEDVPFTFEAFFTAKRVRAFSLDYYFYRQRPGSIMTAESEKSAASRIIIINHVLALLNNNNYTKASFDDYLAYQLWENACATKLKHLSLCKTFIKRRKVSFRGLIRVLFVAIGLPKALSA